jgi:hypothetical protein
MTMGEQTQQQDGRAGDGPGVGAKLAYGSVMGLFHVAMAGVFGLIAVAGMFGAGSVEMLWTATAGGHYEPDWMGVAGLIGLSFSGWLICWVGIRHIWERWRSGERQVIADARAGSGAVMVETLIVLVPFMLLTSGVSQLVMNQSAHIMAHYAAYQSARTHWVWHNERNSARGTNGSVSSQTATRSRIRNRARLAAALVMAPSAPADFTMNAPGNSLVTNMQKIMKASYISGNQGGSSMSLSSSASASGASQNLSFARALGGAPFPQRASRKLAFAYAALDEGGNFTLTRTGGTPETIGVEFTYPMQQAFPWFAWLHAGNGGGCRTVAGRDGCYVPLRRKADFQEQIGVYSST